MCTAWFGDFDRWALHSHFSCQGRRRVKLVLDRVYMCMYLTMILLRFLSFQNVAVCSIYLRHDHKLHQMHEETGSNGNHFEFPDVMQQSY